MREKLKKIVAYIFRSWEDEPGYTHPLLKILPPFFFELLAYFIVGSNAKKSDISQYCDNFNDI
jgi:hypothetical protein